VDGSRVSRAGRAQLSIHIADASLLVASRYSSLLQHSSKVFLYNGMNETTSTILLISGKYRCQTSTGSCIVVRICRLNGTRLQALQGIFVPALSGSRECRRSNRWKQQNCGRREMLIFRGHCKPRYLARVRRRIGMEDESACRDAPMLLKYYTEV
jgi:hypothetical protein